MNVNSGLLALFFSGAALAGTTYSLPDPLFRITPNGSGTTTTVAVNRATYNGPSAFYYVSKCAKADTTSYHCMVIREDHVKIVSGSGAVAFVTLIVQSASVLIRSGHHHWRQTDTVLAGSLTVP